MISVIIRNKNEAEHIGMAIQSVVDYIGSDAEILVIDDNSSDDSLKVVSLFDRLNIKIIEFSGRYSPGKALNLGAKLASYNTLLILSAHSQITKLDISYIEDKLKVYKAIFGKQIPIYRGKKINPRYIWSHFKEDEIENMFSKIENRPFLHNAFCFYDKNFLLQNPFNESLVGKEDRYWARDIVNQNYKYLYTNLLRANHYYTNNGATWKGIG